ncbi:MAG: hypothetical protein PHV11_01460 [Candidatus Bipolaricaulis sp.]|nr:hypothetical protein [Candidatus Bipolaricaulis sp.]MDD5219220.1 hypothetical protein [Candidatus Bipolaricaulis sp.]MDD5646737.1 hypothetical protein [Candidatus Bipolaricaulis sp.]
MRLRTGTAAVAVVILSALMLFSWAAAAADGYREGYELGSQQGKEDSPMINIVWGILGGVIAFGVAAFSTPPDPSAARLQQLEGKSADYKAGYFEGYSQARQQSRVLYVGGGALLPTIVAIILIGGLI